MRRAILALLSLAIALTLASCGRNSSMTLSASDSGRSIDVHVGDTFTIALDGNPTTGFDWSVTGAIAPVLEQTGRTFTPQSSALGAGGTVRYEFRVAAAGTVTLTLVYRRSFESLPPERTFTVTVIAR